MLIPFFKPDIALETQLQRTFRDVLASNQFILGEKLALFESDFSKYLGVQHTIGVASGLDALKIAFQVLEIKPGDEVIVASNAFYACFLAISSLGGIPVLVEPSLRTLNIDPLQIEEKITSKTRFILAVHAFGESCDMDVLTQISEKYNLKLIEDFSQAHGAHFKGKMLGTFGQVNACSFYPSKNLGALGDGGAVTTNDPLLADSILKWRNYGSSEKNKFEIEGYNSRLDELQAAFLAKKLLFLDINNTKRRAIAKKYIACLSEFETVQLPSISTGSVFHQFVIRLKNRDQLKTYLEENGVQTMIHYPIPAHRQKVYAHQTFSLHHFPIADELATTSLSLPISPFLTEEELDYCCFQLKKFFKNA